MTGRKHRLTVTVNPELVEAGQRAVESGQAESVSGWVSAALEDKVRRDRKLALLAAAVADYEKEFGEISAEEISTQRRPIAKMRALFAVNAGRLLERRSRREPRPRQRSSGRTRAR